MKKAVRPPKVVRPPTLEANIGLAGWSLKREGISRRDPDYLDSFQEGLLALWKASQKFDPARGFEFATYATKCIRLTVRTKRRNARGIPAETQRLHPEALAVAHPEQYARFKDGSDAAAHVPSPHAGPARSAEAREISAQVRKAINRLPVKERIVIELLVFQEWKQSEVAALLHLSKQRIGQLKASAVRRLKANEELKAMAQED
jgi:RNA polymerase sigma factor (sigma-70 family)